MRILRFNFDLQCKQIHILCKFKKFRKLLKSYSQRKYKALCIFSRDYRSLKLISLLHALFLTRARDLEKKTREDTARV